MTTERSTTPSLLFVFVTTTEYDVAQTAGGNAAAAPSSRVFHFRCAILVMSVVGMAGNALILYAMVASKQHKKHALIFNQNVLDLFSCLFLVISYSLKLGNVQLSEPLGYWLCIIVMSEVLVGWGTVGSIVNLALITVDRYLKTDVRVQRCGFISGLVIAGLSGDD